MKTINFCLAATAAIIGFATAYAKSNRTVYTYVNLMNNGKYTLLTTGYNPALCVFPSTYICAYTSPWDLNNSSIPNPTAAQIIAAGGHIKTDVAKVYYP